MNDRADWLRLVPGLAVVFGLFHASATILGSDRGQRGLLVGSLVVASTAGVYRFMSRRPGEAVVRRLGLGAPRAEGMMVASVIAVLLWIAALLFVRAHGMAVSFYPGWLSLLPGLFAQAGIAEEVLFRGYLFGQLRRGRTFWQAAAVSMVPFVGVHLILFVTMPWPIALASVLLSAIISFPLARLFESGGHTIWPAALLHFVIQGTPKVLVFPEGAESFPLAWMAASATIPLLVFARVRETRASS